MTRPGLPAPRENRMLGAAVASPVGSSDDGTWIVRYGAGLVRRRWRMIAVVAVAVVAAATAYVRSRTPQYEGTATVRVYEKDRQLPVVDVVPFDNDVTTEMQMLQSRTLAAYVVDSLGLRLQLVAPADAPRSGVLSSVRVAADAPVGTYSLRRQPSGAYLLQDLAAGDTLATVGPGQPVAVRGVALAVQPALDAEESVDFAVTGTDEAIAALKSGISVARPLPTGSVIAVTYRSPDPALARDVPNVLVGRFLQDRQDTRQSSSRSMAEFLRAEIAKISTRLRDAEDSLRVFREARGVVSLPDQASSDVRELAGLVERRNTVATERTALGALLATAGPTSRADTSRTPSPYRHLVAFPTLIQNHVIGQLLSSLTETEDRITELSTRRSAQDPDVKVLVARVKSLEEQLRNVCDAYLQGLTNEAAALDGTIADTRRSMGRLPVTEMRVRQLERDQQGLEQTYMQLQTRLKDAEIAEVSSDPSVQLVDAAALPIAPVNTRARLLLAGSLVLGLLLGLAAALVRELADPAVHTHADVEAALGRPVLAMIPRIVEGGGRHRLWSSRAQRLLPAVSGANGADRAPRLAARARTAPTPTPFTPLADAYDRLHTNLVWSQPEAPTRTVLFTSALPGDGKTTSATNFAITLVQRGLRVLLVDGDLRRGMIHRVFTAPIGPGLSELLDGSVEVAEVVRRVEIAGGGSLDYIPAGHIMGNPTQLLSSPRAAALLETFAGQYDRVVIDSSPLNVVSEATILAGLADRVVFVVRAGVTPFDALTYAAEQMALLKTPLDGVVMNAVDFGRAASYDPAYRWYSHGQRYYAAQAEARQRHLAATELDSPAAAERA